MTKREIERMKRRFAAGIRVLVGKLVEEAVESEFRRHRVRSKKRAAG